MNTREKLIKAIESGNVQVADEEALARINTNKPDFTITKVNPIFGPNVLELEWATQSAGFGTTTFYIQNGKVCCEAEGMSKNFIMSVLQKLVDDAKIV